MSDALFSSFFLGSSLFLRFDLRTMILHDCELFSRKLVIIDSTGSS